MVIPGSATPPDLCLTSRYVYVASNKFYHTLVVQVTNARTRRFGYEHMRLLSGNPELTKHTYSSACIACVQIIAFTKSMLCLVNFVSLTSRQDWSVDPLVVAVAKGLMSYSFARFSCCSPIMSMRWTSVGPGQLPVMKSPLMH